MQTGRETDPHLYNKLGRQCENVCICACVRVCVCVRVCYHGVLKGVCVCVGRSGHDTTRAVRLLVGSKGLLILEHGTLLQPGTGPSACFSVSVSVSVSVIVSIDAGVDACFSVRVDVAPGAEFGVGKTGANDQDDVQGECAAEGYYSSIASYLARMKCVCLSYHIVTPDTSSPSNLQP